MVEDIIYEVLGIIKSFCLRVLLYEWGDSVLFYVVIQSIQQCIVVELMMIKYVGGFIVFIERQIVWEVEKGMRGKGIVNQEGRIENDYY